MKLYCAREVDQQVVREILSTNTQKIDLFIIRHFKLLNSVGAYFCKDNIIFYFYNNNIFALPAVGKINSLDSFEEVYCGAKHKPLEYSWEEIIEEL